MLHIVGSHYTDNSEQLICDLHKLYTFFFQLPKCIQWKNMRIRIFNKMHTYCTYTVFQSALSRMIQISDIGVSYVYWILDFVYWNLFFISVRSLGLVIDLRSYNIWKDSCECISLLCCTLLIYSWYFVLNDS